MRRFPTIPLILITAFLSGCGDNREPAVYTVPKDKEAPAAPFMHSPMPPGGQDMAMQQLPEESLNADAENPDWILPEGWEELPASSMRRASFAAPGSAGAVDIAVTSFPGDVGGLLANINRWRGQIDLPPISAEALSEQAEELEVHGKAVTIARMSGAEQATHAAIFMHDGNSWFFKMTGPNASVAEQGPAFSRFIQTIQFPADE